MKVLQEMKPVKTCQKWSKMKRNLYSFISPSYFELNTLEIVTFIHGL
jgi:hypothetical protein